MRNKEWMDRRQEYWEEFRNVSPLIRDQIYTLLNEHDYDFNNPQTRQIIKIETEKILHKYHIDKRIRDYRVTCDDTNNPPDRPFILDVKFSDVEGTTRIIRTTIHEPIFENHLELKKEQIFSELDPYGEENWIE